MSVRRGVFVLAVVAAMLVVPSVAVARDWVEGAGGSSLSVGSVDDVRHATIKGAEGLRLEQKVLWQYVDASVDLFQPFSAEQLDDGSVLVTDRDNARVSIVSRDGRVLWSYSRLDDPNLRRPNFAQALPSGNVLITDRGTDSVIEVERATKRIVWRYGVSSNSYAAGSLYDPYSATQSPDGQTIVIADNLPAARVIEVRKADYAEGAVNLGWSEGSIVWSYGVPGSPGIGPGQLASPRRARKIANGNILIADSEDNVAGGHRVLEIDRAGGIVWQYGAAGESGEGDGYLAKPADAIRLDNGDTVIVEEDGRRMLEVARSGATVEEYGLDEFTPAGGELGKVRSVQRTPQGTTLVADQLMKRVLEFGYAKTGTVVSTGMSLGLPGVLKSVSSITVDSDLPQGASVAVEYSLDGGPWQRPGADGALPASAKASEFRYRLTLSRTGAYSPIVRSVHIVYDVATADPDDSGGDQPPSANPTETPGGSTTPTPTAGGTGTPKKATGHTGASGTGTSGTGSGSGASGGGTGSTVATPTAGTGTMLSSSAGSAPVSPAGPRALQGTLLAESGDGEGLGEHRVVASGGSGAAGGRTLVLLGLIYLTGLVRSTGIGASVVSHIGTLASRLGWR